jgi:lauroyl/myristoyl acyltransferase
MSSKDRGPNDISSIPKSPSEARISHLESAHWRKALFWGLRHIPVSIRQVTMPGWSIFFFLQVPHIRRAIDRNLSHLCHESLARRQIMAFFTFHNYCQCIANAYSVHAGADLKISVEVSGLSQLKDLLARGQGAVIATGHIGNWHLGPYLLAKHGLPPITVVMSEEPNQGAQRIDASFRDKRLNIVYPERDPLLSLSLRAALSRGELVGLQMDRPATKNGLQVSCAGGMARFAAGPALLARSCDAPVVPIFFPLTPSGIQIVISPPLWVKKTDDRERDVLDLTQRLAQVYGDQIRRFPEQWFNFYSFWSESAVR